MSQHSLAEALERLPDLIDRALAGEGIVITRDGEPVVELRAVVQEATAPSRLAEVRTSEDVEAELEWLRSNRVGDRRKLTENAGELLSRLRDDWDR